MCKQNHFNSKDFVSFLIEKGYCYRDKSGTIQCYKAYEDKGYFETKDFVKNNFSGKQMFFTAKGKEVLSKKFKSYKVA